MIIKAEKFVKGVYPTAELQLLYGGVFGDWYVIKHEDIPWRQTEARSRSAAWRKAERWINRHLLKKLSQ